MRLKFLHVAVCLALTISGAFAQHTDYAKEMDYRRSSPCLLLIDDAGMPKHDEMSFTVQGIDRIQDRTVIMNINQVKPQSPKVRIFMDNVRSQIITYYDTRIPALLTKAQAYAGMNQHALALAVLASVPESYDQYPMVAEQMVAIYGEMSEVKSAQAEIAATRRRVRQDALKHRYCGRRNGLPITTTRSLHGSV